MGKKSNAKKEMRKLVEETIKNKQQGLLKKFSKKKSKKELKKELKKKTKKPIKTEPVKTKLKPKKEKPIKEKSVKTKPVKTKLKVNKKKIFGGILAVIMLAILISVGYLLFQRAFRPQPIAKILPAENTIAFIEINSDFNHHQLEKTFKLLEGHPQYSAKKLIQSIENKFTVSYETELKPWLGREIGAVIISSPKREGTINTIYFAEMYSKKNAKNFVRKKASYTEYLGYEMYIAPTGESYTFINDYLFFGPDSQTLQELIEFQEAEEEKLYSSRNYQKINDNLPINFTAFVYINFDQINNNFFKNYPELGEKAMSSKFIQPVIEIFDSEGMALIAMDDKFAIQSFLSLDTEALEESEYITLKEKYTADLAQYVSQDSLAFWGGENLDHQLKRLMEVLSGEDKENLTAFNTLLQNFTLKYFGPEVSLEKDIMPLLKNEFALAIEQENDEIIYKLIIELENAQSDAVSLHEIADNFAEVSAVFEPKVVEHTLEDGTTTKEIVAVPEEILKKESKYKGSTIYEMQMGKQEWGIYYAVVGEIAIISTHMAGVKNVIDSKNGEKLSLKSSLTYSQLIEPVLRSSDEVSYFNTEKLLPILFDPEKIPSFIKPISSISSGKNYFTDGIITINYLSID